jgi:hypothetical protein
MTRAEWEAAFLAELLRLRPHLLDKRTGGANRPAYAIAGASYRPEEDPAAAARAWHEANRTGR